MHKWNFGRLFRTNFFTDLWIRKNPHFTCILSFESFLRDWGKVEKKLRDKTLKVEDLKTLVKWDHHKYGGRKNVDDYDPTIPDAHQKLWICRGCEKKFEGKNYMQKRRDHKKKCWYYTAKERGVEFNHHDSICTCCVVEYRNGKTIVKRKATKVVYETKKKGSNNKRRRKKWIESVAWDDRISYLYHTTRAVSWSKIFQIELKPF